MAKIPKKILKWRRKQEKGAIMKSETFQRIVKSCMRRTGFDRERCIKIAGAAYWKTAKAKYQKT